MAKTFRTTIMTGSQLYYFIEHNLGTSYYAVDVRESETKNPVIAAVNYMDENTLSVCNLPKNMTLEITVVDLKAEGQDE